MLTYMARHLATGKIDKDSAFYEDALKLLVKNDLGYTALSLVGSIYYNDPEEALAHFGHNKFLEFVDSMSALPVSGKPPLVLRNPIMPS